jgi:hypothetical protein
MPVGRIFRSAFTVGAIIDCLFESFDPILLSVQTNGAVEADGFAVDHGVFYDASCESRIFIWTPKARREG